MNALVFFAGLVVGYVLSAVIGFSMIDGIKRDAVAHGVAEYISTGNGNTEWKWKEAK